MNLAPLCTFAPTSLDVANDYLARWGHRMGPCRRKSQPIWAHALFGPREPLAVMVAATLIRPRVAGLNRSEAVELARLCAAAPTLNRAALRLWREFALPEICQSGGYTWAVSYQDRALHSGNTYRFDGWALLGSSSSGTDQRSGRRGRRKNIWGWRVPAELLARLNVRRELSMEAAE